MVTAVLAALGWQDLCWEVLKKNRKVQQSITESLWLTQVVAYQTASHRKQTSVKWPQRLMRKINRMEGVYWETGLRRWVSTMSKSYLLLVVIRLYLSWTYFLSCLITLHLINDCYTFFHALQRATALLDRTGPRSRVHKYGHTGILTMDVAAKVQGISTFRATFNAPKILGVRQKGIY